MRQIDKKICMALVIGLSIFAIGCLSLPSYASAETKTPGIVAISRKGVAEGTTYLVPDYAYKLLTYSRQYHKTVSDLETFFRVVIPRLAVNLPEEAYKTNDGMVGLLRSNELFPPLSVRADFEVRFIDTRNDIVSLRRPEELSGKPYPGIFVVDCTFVCPFNEDVRAELAKQRLGEATEEGIRIRFLPSVVDVPSLLMQTR